MHLCRTPIRTYLLLDVHVLLLQDGTKRVPFPLDLVYVDPVVGELVSLPLQDTLAGGEHL